MTYQTAKTLLRTNIENLSLEAIQRLKVRIIDAWRESKAKYGFIQAVKNGFYQIIEDSYASGFSPRDMWLTYQLEYMLDKIEAKEKQLLCIL